MPIYAYRCSMCGIEFEENVPMADRDAERHCSCGGIITRRWGVGGVVIR